MAVANNARQRWIASVVAPLLLLAPSGTIAAPVGVEARFVGRFSTLLAFTGLIEGESPSQFGNATVVVADGDAVLTASGLTPQVAGPGRPVAVVVLCRASCVMSIPQVLSFTFATGRAWVSLMDAEAGEIELTLTPKSSPSTSNMCRAEIQKTTYTHYRDSSLFGAVTEGLIWNAQSAGGIGGAWPAEPFTACVKTAKDVAGVIRLGWDVT